MTLKKGHYSKMQLSKAQAILKETLKGKPWGLTAVVADRLEVDILKISSPMFFIQYERSLLSGKVAGSVSAFNDECHRRRASFV